LSALASVPADIRLYIHIGGAMAFVASLVLATFALANAHRRGDQASIQFAFRVLVMAVLPSYVVMRVGAQLALSYEHLQDAKATWIDIGFIVSEPGLLLIIASVVITGLASRRAKAGTAVAGWGALRVATVLTSLLIAGCAVAVWAMTTKPA
jgi:hypothetical protein